MCCIGKEAVKMNRTLYLIQSPFSGTEHVLKKLHTLYQSGDEVVLMGDAVLHFNHWVIQGLDQVSILNQDADNVLIPTTNMRMISYTEFATLCLRHSRCISLK